MEHEHRQELESVAERLHLHRGTHEERAKELHGQVSTALEKDDHEGLADRFEEEAIGFENEHPSLASILRQAAATLSAGGL
jgi:hypothetical protein